jgi:hypothetical protein
MRTLVWYLSMALELVLPAVVTLGAQDYPRLVALHTSLDELNDSLLNNI